MKDSFGRDINYMRISITDQCNLRCRYCLPTFDGGLPETELLTYDEIMRICAQAVALGITRFKITGGEPLVRRDASQFIAELKRLSGVEQVTLTTNGLLLDRLENVAMLDGINISLDALSEEIYAAISGTEGAAKAANAVTVCAQAGVPTKVNTVLLEENASEWLRLAALAESLPVAVRFIELMPLGYAEAFTPVPRAVLLDRIGQRYPDLVPTDVKGNGPAQYWTSSALRGSVGCIAANSDCFCSRCNRVRLTAAGCLRPCLGNRSHVDMKRLLRSGISDDGLRTRLAEAVFAKPERHTFDVSNPARCMNEIGG